MPIPDDVGTLDAVATGKMDNVLRGALRKLLDSEGVDPLAYSLDGHTRDECLILEPEPGGWCVYYSERGGRSGPEHYATEDDACDEMARMLLADRGNRYVLIVGPLPPDEADVGFDTWLREHGFDRSALRPDDYRVDNPILRAGEQRMTPRRMVEKRSPATVIVGIIATGCTRPIGRTLDTSRPVCAALRAILRPVFNSRDACGPAPVSAVPVGASVEVAPSRSRRGSGARRRPTRRVARRSPR